MKLQAVLSTGLGQGKISNGMLRLRDGLFQQAEEIGPPYVLDVLVCSYKEWPSVKEIAEAIIAGKPDQIMLVGHSFGVWFNTLLAKALNPRPVGMFGSADGVGRNPLGSKLTIWHNVKWVRAWWQAKGIIKGSPIEVLSPTTVFDVNQQVDRRHAFVDEDAGFQSSMLEFARLAML